MYRIFLLLALVTSTTHAQINESFNDDNFTANPIWTGHDSHFIINTSGELQLNASDAGTSYLATSSETLENSSWECGLRMGFNPSSANFVRIYLAADNADLNQMQNGLFVEVGSTQDNVCLYKVENGQKEKLIEGSTDRVDVSTVDIKIKVQRTNNDWLLQSDTGSGYIDEGTATYNPTVASSYFGLYCTYTTTRKDKIFFDDIIVTGDPYKDKNPPVVSAFKLINGTKIQLTFNEPLDETTLTNECFQLRSSQRHPNSINWQAEDQTLMLTFDPPLDDVNDDALLVSQVKDLDGNVIEDVAFTFSYERIKLIDFKLINSTTLEILFSKAVPPASFNEAQFTIDGNDVSISSLIDLGGQQSYHLILNRELDEGIKHQCAISRLYDAIGDEVPEIKAGLSYYFAKRFDVVFNELMLDPSPSMGLPETEFIELYNTTNQTISLSNWILDVNGKKVLLPDTNFEPETHMLFVPSSSIDQWTDYENTIALKSWPALTNTACELSLYNSNNEVMDALQLTRDEIYGEPFKADGGWSIERLDAGNVSADAENFHWSMNLSGGTPGLINSTAQENADATAPSIEYIEMLNDTLLQLNFSETMRLFDAINLELNPQPEAYTISIDTVFLKHLNLHFSQALPINQVYQLSKLSITDYANHPLALNEPLPFGVSDSLAEGDILINEVLFNPRTDGVDFVELYNTSDKLIAISDIYLADIKDEQIEKLHQASTIEHLFLPHSYLVLTSDKTILQQHYDCKYPKSIIEVGTMPSLPDNEGTVAIANHKGQLLDIFAYSYKMHFDLLKDEEGVSLERLALTRATNDQSNWHSAASTVGYATPGYQNSQQVQVSGTTNSTFSVSPEIFTPNSNGKDDMLYIHYNNTEVGGTATIRIYSSEGTPVKYLANNESMAMAGYFVWDGLSDKGEALPPSIYVIYIQSQFPSGKLIEEKLSCVIGTENQ